MKYLPLLFISTLALISGCGGGGSTTNSEAPRNIEQPSELVTIKGVITLPDGSTPLVGATVYVSVPSIATMSIQATEDEPLCEAPRLDWSHHTCTDESGAFSLVVTRNEDRPTNVFVEKGAFFSTLSVNTATAVNDTVDIGPKAIVESSAGVPRIAVVTGDFDRIEDVLAKTGLGQIDSVGRLIPGTESFDVYDGNLALGGVKPAFGRLLEDRGDGWPKLNNYDILFLNCGVYELDSIGIDPANPELISALRTFVRSGGRLYVTDQSYDYIEQAFPEYLDFYGENGSSSAEPETWDAAQVGLDTGSISASILDNALRAFLEVATCENGPCLNSDNTVEIEGFLDAWAVLEGAHTDHSDSVKLLISGPITTPEEDNVQKPLTAVIKHGAGKIIFSSYHTEDRGSVDFLPQERILQYLVFE